MKGHGQVSDRSFDGKDSQFAHTHTSIYTDLDVDMYTYMRPNIY